MKVKNKTTLEKEIPDVGFVEPGGVIEVPDDLGKSLCQQVDAWEKSTTKKEN